MGGVITGLTLQKRDPERVNLFVDGEFACAISLAQAVTLRKGQRLSETELAELRAGGEMDLAYQRALRYLSARPRSVAEVGSYLAGKGYDAVVVAAILHKLRQQGYVDDETFVRFWVENRNRFRPRGARALRYELRQKGVEDDVIEEALEEQDEEAAAWSVVEGKLERWAGLERREFEQKLMGILARRGFGYDVCRRVCQRAWASLAGDEA